MCKISFIISVYKAERFMERRLRNLLVEQIDQDSEVIVVDSASPENEREIVEKWQAMFPERVKYIRQPERTTYGISWLEGWKIADGELCCNSNADDLLCENFSEEVYKAYLSNRFRSDKRIGFFYTGIHVIDEQGNTKAAGHRRPFDFYTNSYECHQGPSVAWLNSLRDIIDWDLMFERASQYTSAFDFFMWLYFMSFGFEGHAIPDILTIYVQRKDSIENSAKELNTYQSLCSIAEFFPYHFDGKLKCYKEFKSFPLVPNQDKWIECKQRNKPWKEEYGHDKI